MKRAAVGLVLALILGGPLAGARAADWTPDVAAARSWAADRKGTVAFAVIDAHGRERSVGGRRHWRSASTLKPLLMTTYLRRRGVRSRPLRPAERRLLSPMIRASANGPANLLTGLLGRRAIERFARASGLRSFRLALPLWGWSRITALGYARFFRGIERATPPRHRRYARELLRTVIPRQRWGVPRAAPDGWRILLKGGWARGSRRGRLANQAATLERDGQRITVVVLTDGNPNHDYGTRTVEGVARRLLRGL